jgi:hypothetical protein
MQLPQVSPDGSYWWDGYAWRAMPTLSPDGNYWWDGRAWQPVPAAVPAEVEGAEPYLAPGRLQGWRSEDVGPYGASNGSFAGPPSAFGPPPASVAAAAIPDLAARQPRNVAGDVVLWAGVAVGFLFVICAGAIIVQLHGTRLVPVTELVMLSTAAVVLIAGGLVIGLASGLRLLGLSLFGQLWPVVSELAIFGSLTAFGLAIDDVAFLASPSGTIPVFIPWTALLTTGYKAWRGKWRAAAVLGFLVMLALVLQLPSSIA